MHFGVDSLPNASSCTPFPGTGRLISGKPKLVGNREKAVIVDETPLQAMRKEPTP
jgi:hypothetical protein